MKRLAASMALAAACACSSPARSDAPHETGTYRFAPGLVLANKVECRLSVSMAGSHPDFLVDGKENWFEWALDGVYENEVMEAAPGGPAILERRVRSVNSSGSLNGKSFEFRWDESRPPPELGSDRHIMDKFVADQVVHRLRYEVGLDGKFGGPVDLDRLVVRSGMMSWPLGDGADPWETIESFAVPLLHQKVKLRFRNVIEGEVIREGRRVRIVRATAAPEFSEDGVKYDGWARAKVEFDRTHGRLERLEVEVSISFSGTAQVSGGGEGVIAGGVSYRETQAGVP